MATTSEPMTEQPTTLAVRTPETVAQVRDFLRHLPEGEVIRLHSTTRCLGAQMMRVLNADLLGDPVTALVIHRWTEGTLVDPRGEGSARYRDYEFTGAVADYFDAVSDAAQGGADRTAGVLLRATEAYLTGGHAALLAVTNADARGVLGPQEDD